MNRYHHGRMRTLSFRNFKVTVWGTLLFLYSTLGASASPSIIKLNADGTAIPLNGSTPEISPSAQKIVFHLNGDSQEPYPGFTRLRYKLQGIDNDWRQLEGGSATFTICFYDQAGTRFGQKTHEVKGISPGWNKDLGKATFTHHRETFIAPEQATNISFIISSAGSPPSVGVYAVKNITITRAESKDRPAKKIFDILSAMPPKKEAGVKSPLWTADGSHRSMAQILNLKNKNDTESILTIVDDDQYGHAEWRLGGDTPEVSPGDTLIIEWDETYQTAVGELRPIEYGKLAPGHYTFNVQEVDVWGDSVGEETTLAFTVPIPYWEKTWFWAICIVIANALVLLGWRYSVFAKARQRNLLDQERLRIAQDLHDDLGSYITHISLLSSYAATQPNTPESLANLREISKVTRSLVSALSETVWTVNPENDNLESLVGFLCRNIEQLCAIANVRCRIDALAQTDFRTVPSNVRHHIILAVKEALNNALKHSGTEELHARITFQSPVLHIVITDQGRGFSTENSRKGNGLANMQRRMESMCGRVTVESKEGNGTTVHFEVPIP